jgi:hypothetical protein
MADDQSSRAMGGPGRGLEPQARSALVRAWRGEISLYRAAYGLGGLALVAASFLGATVLEISETAGIGAGWFSNLAGDVGGLAAAWFAFVATWRAAQRRRPNGRAYGVIAVSLALAFVGVQMLVTTAWTGWNGLAEIGMAPDPSSVLLRAMVVSSDGDSAGFDQVIKALHDLPH